MAEKLVLAYSGGLDTSVAIRWLKEDRGYDVIALTVDVGQQRDLPQLQKRAEATGAIKAVVRDGRDLFQTLRVIIPGWASFPLPASGPPVRAHWEPTQCRARCPRAPRTCLDE